MINFIAGIVLGWWLGPAFTDIAKKVWAEFRDWRIR